MSERRISWWKSRRIPVGSRFYNQFDVKNAGESFAAYGSASASTVKANSLHPSMHRAETIDDSIVLSGEMYSVLDKTETRMQAGDAVVQRGTNRAWSNRSNAPCRMAFVLIDGAFDPKLRQLFDK
jgi:naringenin degradation protein FdeH